MAFHDIASLPFNEIQEWFVDRGEKAFRGSQVFGWLHRQCVSSYGEMTNLSRPLRDKLGRLAPLKSVEIVKEEKAADGTRKFLFRLFDAEHIEGVWMPSPRRHTLCISTQVGCAMGCTFCATGTLGLNRNLSAGEIVGQVEAVTHRLRSDRFLRPISNVVFMGMGEPLANLDATVTAANILLDDRGLGLSRRHVTVSTVGLVPAMGEFVRRTKVKLAVSLNAASDSVRSSIMPINKRFPLAELMGACRLLPLSGADRVTFEYVLLGGINDGLQDARHLVRLLASLSCKVNLIPYNPFGKVDYKKPEARRVDDFLELLASKQISAFVRASRGESLKAACGQLVAQEDEIQ
jgi:23S rRNA (adenine2503-C2)-methyltransferase